MRAPQLGDEARAELVDRRSRIAHPFGEQLGRRAVAQEIKSAVPQHQGRAAGKEHRLLHGSLRAIGQAQLMGKRQIGGAVAQAG